LILVGGSARLYEKGEGNKNCRSVIYTIGHGVITSLQIEGNQAAYQKKGLYNDG
jgi:hypothetical protein